MRIAPLLALALVFSTACKDADGKQEPAPAPAPAPAPKVEAAPAPATGSGSGSGSAASKDLKKGDQQDEDWVPAEFKSGMSRWKDVGVYVDGKPIAFLTFGELPITLKPTWVKDKVSDNKPADCPIEKCPGWKWAEQRFYKFKDYLAALGVDIHKIKELHVYGPKLSQTIIVKRADLLEKKADDFMFRFGADITGKPIPHVPDKFGNGKQPDKINGVMIYIDRKPPTLTRDGLELDGQQVTGVPYYGEPLRGGVRVYLDDKLAAIIKRQELDAKQATTGSDGELEWSFADFLKQKGVDTSKLVEVWLIRDDRRAEKLPWSDVANMRFEASSKAKGGVSLGDHKLRANSIALHTRPIKPDELPVIRPEEEF